MSYDDIDALGYKKPPVWSQFKKGTSGNPKGRPRNSNDGDKAVSSQSTLDDLLHEELNRTVTITEGGKQKKLTLAQLVSRAQISAAAKGNPMAQRDVMKHMRELEQRNALRAEALLQSQEAQRKQEISVFNFVASKKRKRQQEWDEAEMLGTEPDEIWPHPDDILLYPKKHRWTYRGPICDDDVPRYEYYRAERDYFFAQAELEDRVHKKRARALSDIYMNFWVSYDVMLPLRWQIAGDCMDLLLQFHHMPLRELRASVDKLDKRRDFLRLFARIPPPDKEAYREVNAIFKPLLKRHGYRSLAEFDHAFEADGTNMQWPKANKKITA
jgi:hypothetical protein